jgi:hypothetical protein
MVTTPKPVFFRSIDRGVNRETADYVSGEIIKVANEVCSDKVIVVVSDRAPNMVAALRMVTEEFPHICGVGCACHGLQNFLHDLHDQRPVRVIVSMCKKIIKEIKLSHVKLAFFKQKQSEDYGNKAKSLKLPPKTRFSYIVLTLESLLANKSALQATVINNALEIADRVRTRVLDERKFWPKVSVVLQLLKPIAIGILMLESDSSTLSEAFEVFLKVKDSTEQFCDKSDDFFSIMEEQAISRAFKKRYDMTIDVIHYAVDLLDPRFQGSKLTSCQRVSAYEYIKDFAKHLNKDDLNFDVDGVLENLGQFCEKSGPYAPEVLWETAFNHKPASWWKVLCGSQPLAPIASRLLQLPCANTASERNWSQQADVHTKKKNRLKPEKARKLVTVRAYLNHDGCQKKNNCKLTFVDFLKEDFCLHNALDSEDDGNESDYDDDDSDFELSESQDDESDDE